MKRVYVVTIGVLMLTSIVAAQTADSAKTPITAEEACKLAYQWTGFDKGRPEDLIPKCRVELVDSGYLKQPDLKRHMSSKNLWRVTFDSVRLARTGWDDDMIRSQKLRRCELFFGPSDSRLLLVSIFVLGTDTSNIPRPEDREIQAGRDSLEFQPTPIDLQSALSKALVQPFSSKLVECVCARPKSSDTDNSGPYWWICAHSVEIEDFFIGERHNGRQSMCIDAITGKWRCGLDFTGEGWFQPTSDDVCELAYRWTGFDKSQSIGHVPYCQAELVDSSVLPYSELRKGVGGPKIWRAVFDSVRLPRPKGDGQIVGTQKPMRCELYMDPRTERLLLARVVEVGLDTSTVAPSRFRRFSLDSGYLSNSPPTLNLATCLSDAGAFRLVHGGILELAYVSRHMNFAREEVYWRLFRHGEVFIPHEGVAIGGEAGKFDVETGKFQKVGIPWKERMH